VLARARQDVAPRFIIQNDIMVYWLLEECQGERDLCDDSYRTRVGERDNVCSVAAADAHPRVTSSAWREWHVCTYWRTMALSVEWIHYIFLLNRRIIYSNQTVKSCTPTDPILSYS
jgi:hypothetical protein